MKFLFLALLFLSQNAFALKIVSTSPAITDMIKLLNEEKSLVAVSDYCKSDLPKIGSSLDLNIEKVAMINPDWVIVQKSSSIKVVDNLIKSKINFIELKIERLDDIDNSFLKMAEVFNKREYAQKILDQYKDQIPKSKKAQSVIIVLGDDGRGGQWSVASDETLYSDMLELLGHRNSFKGQKGKYALLGPEEILKLNSDTFIFLATNLDVGIFKNKKSRLIFMGCELAQIPSPRIYEFIKELGAKLQ